MGSDDQSQDTRERLLQAAGEVFSECGYRAATIREISKRANANVAAVNYHFRDKENLYATVLRYSLDSALRKYPPDLGLKEGATPEEQLKAFIRSLLLRILDEGGLPTWHGRLMTREIAEPTAALDQLVEEAIRPLYERLTSIVRRIVGPKASEESLRLCTMSIIGQCLFYRHSRSVILRLHPEKLDCGRVERLADHIAWFSLCALKDIRVSSAHGR